MGTFSNDLRYGARMLRKGQTASIGLITEDIA